MVLVSFQVTLVQLFHSLVRGPGFVFPVCNLSCSKFRRKQLLQHRGRTDRSRGLFGLSLTMTGNNSSPCPSDPNILFNAVFVEVQRLGEGCVSMKLQQSHLSGVRVTTRQRKVAPNGKQDQATTQNHSRTVPRIYGGQFFHASRRWQ